MGASFSREECQKFVDKINSTQPTEKSSLPWFADVEVDWNGCRKFKALPPIGTHPRLFFTEDDIPRIVARFTHSSVGPSLKAILKGSRDAFMKGKDLDCIPNVTETEKKNPSTRRTIDMFFKSDESRNAFLLGAYVYGKIFDEPDTVERVKRYAVFHAKVILKAKELAIEQKIYSQPYSFWHNNEWNVPFQFLIGGSNYALLYDLMYNELSKEERNIIRSAITTAIQGRSPWGLGWSTRRIQSNWASYHGDFYTLSAVVEGDGDSRKNMSSFADLMTHFLNYAIYDSGHPVEDAYALNLAFREGSLCFLAMARRGYNVFNHPHYKRIWTNWLPQALEPNSSGKIYGGSSGNDWCYPTSAIVARYMFPMDPTVDFVYRRFMCENGKDYARLGKMQCRLPVIMCALPSISLDSGEPEAPERLDLPLNFSCRDRGKVVMRSDWSDSAVWFTFDARPDAFLIGHDTCSRGAFVLNIGGRSWGCCPEWKWFRKCANFSVPLIDGTGQQLKAPSVHLIDVTHQDKFSFASANLTYAYNWMWSEWSREGQNLSHMGFEKEWSDPRDFGFNVWWGPQKIHGENDIGFTGLHYWRKRVAEVENVSRSGILVRATRPFVIIADDLLKDDEEHEYTWGMTTPGDVELESFDGRQAVLKETGGGTRRLVLRNVNIHQNVSCAFREIERIDKVPANIPRLNQIQFRCRGKEAKFRIVMYGINLEEEELKFEWMSTSDEDPNCMLAVKDEVSGETHRVVFSRARDDDDPDSTRKGCTIMSAFVK